MADDKTIPPDQPGTPKSSDATGPSAQLLESIAKLANATVQIHTTMLTLVDDFKKAFETTQKMTGGLKDVLNTSQKVEDVHKRIAEINKRIGAGLGAQKVTYKEVVDDVGDLLALTQRLAKESPTAAAALTRQIRTLEDTLKSAKKGVLQYGDSVAVAGDELKGFQSTVSGVTKEVERLNARFDTKSIAGFESHVRNLNSSLHQMGSSSRIMNKMETLFDTKRAYQRVKADRATQQDLRSAGFHASRIQAHVRHAAAARMSGANETDIDPDAPEMGSQLTSAELGRILAGRKGRGLNARLGNMLQRRMAGEEAGGGGYSRPTKLGMNAMAAGGEEGGMLAGAAEMAMPGVGEALIVAAVVKEAVKAMTSVWDHMAEQNQQIDKGMGGALYTPGQSGGQSLETVRQNLGANLVGAFGQNLTRNLGIAQTMREQGLDTTEISAGKPGDLKNKRLPSGQMPDTGSGFVGGVFGEFQHNAMTVGKTLGLTDSETVVRMTKMLTTMRQTFESTSDFLYSVNSQARMSGLSTTKYLDIIDKLTDSLDNMNKSFDQTVSIVQALGASGTSSADSIEGMAKALTGAGENKTPEQTAYAFQSMTPDMKTALQDTQREAVERAKTQFSKALADQGVNTKGYDMSTPQDVMKMQGLFASMQEGQGKKTLQSAAENLINEQNQMNAVVKPGTTPGGEVAATYGISSYGANLSTKAALQASALMAGLANSGSSMSDLLKPNATVPTLASASASTFGLDPKDFPIVLKGLMDLGAGAPNLIHAMPEGEEKNKKLEDMYNVSKGVPGIGNSPQDMAVNMMNDPAVMAGIVSAVQKDLAANPAKMMKSYAESVVMGDKKGTDEKAKAVTELSRTSADYYANAFEYLFNMLMIPLNTISRIVSTFSTTPDSEVKIADSGDAVKSEYNTLMQSGDLEKAIADLTEIIDNPETDQKTKERDQVKINDMGNLLKTPPSQADQGMMDKAVKAMASGVTDAQDLNPHALYDLTSKAQDPKIQSAIMADGIQKLFAKGGISATNYMDAGHGTATADIDIQGKQLDLLQQMKDAGQITGNIKTGHQTITINAVDSSTQVYSNIVGSHVTAAVGKAGEVASPHGATPTPMGPVKIAPRTLQAPERPEWSTP
jgi:hypothetical protein